MHKCCGVGGNAWAASNSDFGQYLIIDLGQVMNITAVATQGQQSQKAYVMEYRVGYGTNGLDFVDFKEEDGHAKVSSLQADCSVVTLLLISMMRYDVLD